MDIVTTVLLILIFLMLIYLFFLVNKKCKTNYELFSSHDIGKTINHTEALYLLETVTNIFKENNITTWLDCGTLLGVIREKDFLGHDTDVDISSFEDDYDKALQIVNNRTLLEKYNIECWRNQKILISFNMKDKTTYIDIYFWHWKPKLSNINFKNNIYNVPYNPEEYLEHLYGPKWGIPCKENCHADPYNHFEGVKKSKYFEKYKIKSNFNL